MNDVLVRVGKADQPDDVIETAAPLAEPQRRAA
jgi:hypothetical protein